MSNQTEENKQWVKGVKVPRIAGVDYPSVKFAPQDYPRAKRVIVESCSVDEPVWLYNGVYIIGDTQLEALKNAGIKYELVPNRRKKQPKGQGGQE